VSLLVRAEEDPALRVRLLSRRALRYGAAVRDGAGTPQAFVRAASGLCWFRGRLAIVQDDALLLALLDPDSDAVAALELPLRADGARFFDVERGNKRDKPDLEACLAIELGGQPALLAFGSGSRPNRECVAIVRPEGAGYRSELLEAHALYAALRALPGFLSSELNLEGAALVGDRLRVFQRSNGSPLPGAAPLCATVDLQLGAFLAYIEDPAARPPPALEQVRRYDLGSIGSARLTFTDACTLRADALLFTASAEASPNAYDDGAVAGSALGKIEPSGTRWCALRDERGQLMQDKVEGVALDPRDPSRAFLVFDPDDHRTPATLAEVLLEGF
jgi:hypothetical protein